MQDMINEMFVQTLKDGLYLVENQHLRRYLVVMDEYGIGQAFDLQDGSNMTSGKDILKTLGVRRILRLSDKTEINGDWFARDEFGNLKQEASISEAVQDNRDGFISLEERLEASEAFDQCKIRPAMDEVKNRDD